MCLASLPRFLTLAWRRLKLSLRQGRCATAAFLAVACTSRRLRQRLRFEVEASANMLPSESGCASTFEVMQETHSLWVFSVTHPAPKVQALRP